MGRDSRDLHVLGRRLSPTQVDAAFALALLIAIELEALVGGYAPYPVVAFCAVILMTGAVALRRSWPVGALSVGLLVGLAQDAIVPLAQTPVGLILGAIALFYGAGAFTTEDRARMALVVGLAALWIADVITAAPLSEFLFDGVIIGLIPWATGRMLREQSARERAFRESAERLDSERDQRARAAASNERARIARELHDIIAHSVSVMVIQAGGARTVMDAEPERAETSLRMVERAGHEALAEMRRLLGLLDGGVASGSRAPQPNLAHVQQLIDQTRVSGLAATLRVRGAAVAISPALDLCAYRIIQEALTNAIKHAGPARAEVCVSWSEKELELEIADNGSGIAFSGLSATGAGHGLVGMRERAALQGGSVEAGCVNGSGFVVRARLPLDRSGR
jgi:signal transduction histidine kinase